MGFDNPTPKTEDLYIKSINATVDQYRVYLEEVRAGTLVLPNCDLDDGKATIAAEYTLADDDLCQPAGQIGGAEVRRHFASTAR